MKKILLAYLNLCLCLNKISCTTKNNSEEKTLYFREHYGEMGWHTTGKEEKHGKYIGDIKKINHMVKVHTPIIKIPKTLNINSHF